VTDLEAVGPLISRLPQPDRSCSVLERLGQCERVQERDFALWSRAVLAVLWRAGHALSKGEIAGALAIDSEVLDRLLFEMAERGLVVLDPSAPEGNVSPVPMLPARRR
jgi:hypothetical protein